MGILLNRYMLNQGTQFVPWSLHCEPWAHSAPWLLSPSTVQCSMHKYALFGMFLMGVYLERVPMNPKHVKWLLWCGSRLINEISSLFSCKVEIPWYDWSKYLKRDLREGKANFWSIFKGVLMKKYEILCIFSKLFHCRNTLKSVLQHKSYALRSIIIVGVHLYHYSRCSSLPMSSFNNNLIIRRRIHHKCKIFSTRAFIDIWCLKNLFFKICKIG